MKIAVTGASGFIGKYVVEELTHLNAELVLVTRDAARLSGLRDSISIVEMDIAESTTDCYEFLGKPDALIHLAWDGLPNYMSLHHFETELPRQYEFLKCMLDGGLKSLTITGTCFEYGMQSGGLPEDIRMLPDNPYGYAKYALYQQLSLLQKQRGFNLTWLRLFYMYGEGQPKTAIFSLLKAAIERKDEVFNMSGGEQLRDFLSVNKVAQIIAELGSNNGNYGPVNVCNGEPVSIRSLVERWMVENDWSICLNLGYYPYPSYEPMAFWGDSRRLDDVLDAISRRREY